MKTSAIVWRLAVLTVFFALAITAAGCGSDGDSSPSGSNQESTQAASNDRSDSADKGGDAGSGTLTSARGSHSELSNPGLSPAASDRPFTLTTKFTISGLKPEEPVKLVFVHHSVGEAWLDDNSGGLGLELLKNNYFVSDTNYGWGPVNEESGEGVIGDLTDIGHWYNWFAGPHRDRYMEALLSESGQHSAYTRMQNDPGGANEIILIKSCFNNSALRGSPDDPASSGQNLLRGQASGEEVHTIQNAKGIYEDLLEYFATRQDKLFVVITAPPLGESETNSTEAGNARSFNRWLVTEWLREYPHTNVAVFDLFNVLTSNGGSKEINDFEGRMMSENPGNQHRFWNGGIAYMTENGSNYSAYANYEGDSHPTAAGLQKASGSLGGFLNAAYNSWKENAESD